MTSSDKLPVQKPTPLLQKEIKVNPRALINTLGKAAVNGAFLQFDDLAENGVELLGALGLEATPSEVAGLLITRLLMAAFKNLQHDNRELLEPEKTPKDLQPLYEQLTQSLGSAELTIDSSFFAYPEQLSLVQEAKAGFEQWLREVVVEPQASHAHNISSRLDAYFTEALNAEWSERSSDYGILKNSLDTPFTRANRQQQGWLRYRAWLQKKVEEPLFLESFSLQRVYMPIRAYWTEPEKGQAREMAEHRESQRIVTDLAQALDGWLQADNPNDAMRLITGGREAASPPFPVFLPRGGSPEGNVPVLFIPLHLFRLSSDLVQAVGEFIATDGFLPENPLQRGNDHLRLLIIFDGLDELSQQGKMAAEVARQFVEEVKEQVRQFNRHKTRLQVIISGREVVIQAHQTKFRQPQQLLYLLPYFVPEKEREQYVDEQQLLKDDQRQTWWRHYGEAKGKQSYSRLPAELDRPNLVEVTAQPLLNYLVALSYERDKLQFSADTNLNEIYRDLLEAVYERGYEEQRHRVTEGIKQEEFIGILEEIALSCWHGDGRTTTVSEIERHWGNSGLREVLNRLQTSLQSDSRTTVTRLLTAFYFRESGDIRHTEKTFEFTHKSFGEYLAAKRIVEEVRLIHKNIAARQRHFRDGWDEREALIHWAGVCGPTPLSPTLFRFIGDEMRGLGERDAEQIHQWQQTFCRLIKFMLTNGMPMEELRLPTRPTFQEEMRQARNAEEALLAVLSVCARLTQKISEIAWPAPNSLGEWLSKLQGQRMDSENVIALESLSFLNINHQRLYFRDFFRANLEGANLEGANLRGANLERANLGGVNLEGANLDRANLRGANLRRAIFKGPVFEGAILRIANLRGANLEGAILEEAILGWTNLRGAILERANLRGANLERAYLNEAELNGVDLMEANLNGANLQNIVWNTETNWSGARGLEKAKNIPDKLRQQLGLS